MVIPDPEVLVVKWAKSNIALTNLLSGRVATRLPKGPTFPFLRVQLISAPAEVSEAPLGNAVLQFDAFGSDGDSTPDYASASLVARTLVEEADLRGRQTVSGFGTILGMSVVTGPQRIEEPITGYARFMVEILLMSRE